MFAEMEFKEELVHMYNLSSEFLVSLSDTILDTIFIFTANNKDSKQGIV